MTRKKDRNRIQGGFVPLTYEMIDSKAFQKLTGSAKMSLFLCMRKVKTNHHIDRFTFQFSLTYPEAKKHGLWDSAFNRGMKQLQKLGFIECTFKGGMRFQGNACSLYRLSQRWKQYGTTDFQTRHDGYCEAVHGK